MLENEFNFNKMSVQRGAVFKNVYFCTEILINKHMNKKFIFVTWLALAASWSTFSSFAQTTDSLGFKPTGITISTGIDNNVGVIGVSIYHAITNSVILEAGLGSGGWGMKSSINAQYYPSAKKTHFFKLAYVYSSGLENMPIDLESSRKKTESFELDLEPVHTLALTSGWSFPIKHKHRFYFELGYSKLLGDKETSYRVVKRPQAGVDLSDLSKQVMNIQVPGGLVLALGFSFGF